MKQSAARRWRHRFGKLVFYLIYSNKVLFHMVKLTTFCPSMHVGVETVISESADKDWRPTTIRVRVFIHFSLSSLTGCVSDSLNQ